MSAGISGRVASSFAEGYTHHDSVKLVSRIQAIGRHGLCIIVYQIIPHAQIIVRNMRQAVEVRVSSSVINK